MFKKVLMKSRDDHNSTLVAKLSEMLNAKQDTSSIAKGLVYSCWIDILCKYYSSTKSGLLSLCLSAYFPLSFILTSFLLLNPSLFITPSPSFFLSVLLFQPPFPLLFLLLLLPFLLTSSFP